MELLHGLDDDAKPTGLAAPSPIEMTKSSNVSFRGGLDRTNDFTKSNYRLIKADQLAEINKKLDQE